MGLCVAAALKIAGADVYVCDINEELVAAINSGKLHEVFLEPGLEQLNLKGEVIAGTELVPAPTTLICVQTPWGPDYSAVKRVLEQCAKVLLRDSTVVIISTMFPGGMREVYQTLAGRPDIALLYNPTFLATGSGVEDFGKPPKFVVGCHAHAKAAYDYYSSMGDLLDLPLSSVTTNWAVAEWTKLLHNAFMCTKITFANVMGGALRGSIGRQDIDTAFDVCFQEDDGKLLTRSHLMPGPPFSGQCLPKDVLALQRYVSGEFSQSLLEQNDTAIRELFYQWINRGSQLGIIGYTFKSNYDDPRGSLAVRLLEQHVEPQKVKIYDPHFYQQSDTTCKLRARGHKMTIDLIPQLQQTSLEDVARECDSIFVNRKLTEGEKNALHGKTLIMP